MVKGFDIDESIEIETIKRDFLDYLLRDVSDRLDEIGRGILNVMLNAEPSQELFIRIVLDKVKKTLSIIHNGHNLTLNDFNLANKLRKMALGGSGNINERFKKALEAGQLGIGFKVASLVAKKVIVTFIHNDSGESQAEARDVGELRPDRGTKITLFLTDDQLEYLEERRIKDIVQKNSEVINYPVYLGDDKIFNKVFGEVNDGDDEPKNKEEEEGHVEVVGEENENKSKKKKKERNMKSFEGLCKTMKRILRDKVEKVVLSNTIVDLPCCLVTVEYRWSAKGKGIMNNQASSSMSGNMSSKSTLEINPDHGIMKLLRKRAEADNNDKLVEDTVLVLFDTTLLTSGFSLDDLNTYAARICRILKLSLSIDKKEKSFEDLCKVIKDVLGDKVEKVVIPDRVVDSPCCLVRGEYGQSAKVSSKKTMEINPDNGIMEELRKMAEADKNDKVLKDLVLLLFGVAHLTSDFKLDDPKAFAARIHKMLTQVLVGNNTKKWKKLVEGLTISDAKGVVLAVLPAGLNLILSNVG